MYGLGLYGLVLCRIGLNDLVLYPMFVLCWIGLVSIVLACIVLYCLVCCIRLYWDGLACFVMCVYCVVLYCMVSFSDVLHVVVLYIFGSDCIGLACVVLHDIV